MRPHQKHKSMKRLSTPSQAVGYRGVQRGGKISCGTPHILALRYEIGDDGMR